LPSDCRRTEKENSSLQPAAENRDVLTAAVVRERRLNAAFAGFAYDPAAYMLKTDSNEEERDDSPDQ
jgi:hypothetical protein